MKNWCKKVCSDPCSAINREIFGIFFLGILNSQNIICGLIYVLNTLMCATPTIYGSKMRSHPILCVIMLNILSAINLLSLRAPSSDTVSAFKNFDSISNMSPTGINMTALIVTKAKIKIYAFQIYLLKIYFTY